MSSSPKKDMQNLRRKIDGNDTFMNAHQIKKVRVLFGQKDTPSWAMNDKEIQKILLRAFPKLRSSTACAQGVGRRAPRRRQAAARWTQAITLVYRLGMPYNHAAAEMGIKVGTLRSLLRNIRRVALGLRASGSGSRAGKRGRPKLK